MWHILYLHVKRLHTMIENTLIIYNYIVKYTLYIDDVDGIIFETSKISSITSAR